MLYYLFKYLDKLDFPGARMFQYISFRSSLAIITSLLIGLFIGRRIIDYLRYKQIGETVRDLGLEGQMQKKGTPTMGGIIILISLLVPTLLFCDLKNVYVILMIITTVWLGLIGFVDDYIKVFKKDKQGLQGKFKVLGQITLGIIVGLTFYFSPQTVVREKTATPAVHLQMRNAVNPNEAMFKPTNIARDYKTTSTTIPFVKNHEFRYSRLIGFMGQYAKDWYWLVMVVVIIVIVTAVSNGANITDGLDGLASGTSAIIGTTLGILAYVSGNLIYANYLNIMYLPNTGELVVFISAFIGATVGFLWYNTYPAQVFMGDTGSLALGGIIGVFAILIRKELLIPLLCGIFLAENLSVMIQVAYFKYTKKKYGEGRRIFKMAPLHHHYQMKGYPEAKIVTRFWIIGIMLAILTIVTLKIR
ncbi:MAG: phospho-N-acetylmuramoyl-pentapeptide-transferase [Bacteroidota bacterium]|nr:phospho-N-acetylmuramoyl-pentapeptide-transferase [Bacteroidota bacterium]